MPVKGAFHLFGLRRHQGDSPLGGEVGKRLNWRETVKALIGMSKVRMAKKGQYSHFLGGTTPTCFMNRENTEDLATGPTKGDFYLSILRGQS